MHPFLRSLVIGVVGLLIAGGLTALALIGTEPGLSVAAMLASGLIAAATGVFVFIQGWIWSQRAYQEGATGRSLAIAVAGGLMIVLAGAALAGSIVLVLLFYVG